MKSGKIRGESLKQSSIFLSYVKTTNELWKLPDAIRQGLWDAWVGPVLQLLFQGWQALLWGGSSRIQADLFSSYAGPWDQSATREVLYVHDRFRPTLAEKMNMPSRDFERIAVDYSECYSGGEIGYVTYYVTFLSDDR